MASVLHISKVMVTKDEAILSAVKAFAEKAHGEQKRKYTPEPYIVHPIRVMETCRKYTNDLTILSAALLHDVLEDTDVDEGEMKFFLLSQMETQQALRTLQLVIELTDVYVKQSYPGLNRRKRKSKELERIEKTSADAQTIKYADVLDNCHEIVDHDPDFARVFLNECHSLLKKIPKGNQELYQITLDKVKEAQEKLRKRK